MRRSLSPLLVLLLGACSSPRAEEAREAQCTDAAERVGGLACVHQVEGTAAWESIAVPVEAIDQVQSAKYMVPARAGARLAPVFMNSERYELHYDFLVEAFADLFPALTPKQYLDLLFDPELREYYVGAVTEYRMQDGATRFGFTVAGDPQNPASVDCEVVREVHRVLAARFHAPLAAVPSDNAQLAWITGCGLDVIDPTKNVTYEAYNRTVGFGTLRRYTPAELATATSGAEFGFRDVLVLAEAPVDIETVVSGAVTGTRQGPLSHLAVRSASRGTPNCYLDGAYEHLAPWDGKLVRLECARDTLLVRDATLAEAEAFWEGLRPPIADIPEPDLAFSELVLLDELSVQTPEDRALAKRRFGAKGTNLAWLRQHLPTSLTPTGFAIPYRYYAEFMEASSWQVELGAGPALHSFAATLEHWRNDASFLTDGGLRRERLLALQAAMRAQSCDPALLEAVRQLIVEVFGSESITVRFRSSSNAEDGIYFNGAGLYDSYSGCMADDLDADDLGPSICDPERANERGVCRALTRVWASLHNPKAYDERDFFGIDQHKVVMGVLVNERSELELANFVAFDGNPVSRSDRRFLVSAQVGEMDVVSPPPGTWPEQNLLTVEQGVVKAIERITASSELAAGEHVLEDAELSEVGALMAGLAASYPFDAEAPTGRVLLIDTEWKIMPGKALRIKQIRPFLR